MRLIPRRRSQRQSRAAARGSTSALMRWFRAPAKINLTLRVIGRRTDGYHDIESLVAFAGICDWLGYEPGYGLELDVCGPRALEAGAVSENLVLHAATALAHRVPRLTLGRFHLFKRLPAAAGLGGGSSDAAAAFRALADANGLRIEDERLRAAALDTGADVPVCLAPRSRVMSGIGDRTRTPDPLAENVRRSGQPWRRSSYQAGLCRAAPPLGLYGQVVKSGLRRT